MLPNAGDLATALAAHRSTDFARTGQRHGLFIFRRVLSVVGMSSEIRGRVGHGDGVLAVTCQRLNLSRGDDEYSAQLDEEE